MILAKVYIVTDTARDGGVGTGSTILDIGKEEGGGRNYLVREQGQDEEDGEHMSPGRACGTTL